MDETDFTNHVNNLEPEGLSARDDARIIDAEMTAFKGAGQATVGNLSASITAMNRPLLSQQFTEAVRAMNRPLLPQQFTEAVRAMNRPLLSQQFTEAVRAMNRPPVNNWYVASTISLNLIPTVVTTREEPQTWPDSVGVGAEEHSLTGEWSYWFTLFDALIKDDGLRRYCRSLFVDGYYALAVQGAYIYIDNCVSELSGRADKDGADLMRTVFSPKNPVLKLNNLQGRSGENQQQGYMHIFEGAMIGIRNPRAHEYAIEDTPGEALEMLVLANHLIRMLKRSILA